MRNDHDRAQSLSDFIPLLADYELFADAQSLDILNI